MLTLIHPELKYLTSATQAVAEYRSEIDNPFTIEAVHRMVEMLPDNFAQYLQKITDEKNCMNLKNGYVPHTTFWLVDDDKYIGTLVLRHCLTENLKLRGGHIACQIRPSERCKGFAFAGIKLCLEQAHKSNIDATLITCREDNIASYNTIRKVMIDMGGLEAEPAKTDKGVEKRFWIYSQQRHNGKIRTLAIAVIRKNGKVLAMRGFDDIKKQTFYRLPGGGIEFGETSEDALHREMKEEIGTDINIHDQIGVFENIFEFNGKKGHEIVIAYNASLPENLENHDKIAMIESEFEGKYMEFISPDDVYPIFPDGIIKKLDL